VTGPLDLPKDELTPDEPAILNHLRDAWIIYGTLEILHADHPQEFKRAIQEAQRLILVRPVKRGLDWWDAKDVGEI
jgi:hypothetical protein